MREGSVAAPGSRWVLVVGPEEIETRPLPEGEVVVGSGAGAGLRLRDPTVAEAHLRLFAEGGLLAIEAIGGAPAKLNDVQISVRSVARDGDQLSIGQTELVVLPPVRQEKGPAAPVSRETLEALLEVGLARARPEWRPVQLVLVESSAAELHGRGKLIALLESAFGAPVVGELGPRSLGLLVGGITPAEAEAAIGRVSTALGRGGVRFAVGLASFPEDATDPEGLWAVALERLAGEADAEEPLVLDPVMTRLWALLERVARTEAPVVFWGEDGVGRRTFARALHEKSPRAAAPLVFHAALANRPEALEPAVRKAEDGTLVLSGVEAVAEAELAALLSGRARVVICHDRPLGLPRASSVYLPPLRDRRGEVVPFAEASLARFARSLARERRVLSPPARERIAAHDWPGNLRALKNAMALAALATRGPEVPPDALPGSLQRTVRGGVAGDLRSTLKATEREALLAALAATRWNVTRAAERLGLPRRTVVYRMARLGLKRPGR